MKDDLVKAVPHQLRSILIQNTTWQRHFLMKDELVKAVPQFKTQPGKGISL